MRRLVALLFLVACLAPGPAAAGSITRAPVEDLGLPLWCEWGYDWDTLCAGPYFPSAGFAAASLRPGLMVSYVVPTTGLSP